MGGGVKGLYEVWTSSFQSDTSLYHLTTIWVVLNKKEACRGRVITVPWSLCYWCIQRQVLEFWTVQPPEKKGGGGQRWQKELRSVKRKKILHNNENRDLVTWLTVDSISPLLITCYGEFLQTVNLIISYKQYYIKYIYNISYIYIYI